MAAGRTRTSAGRSAQTDAPRPVNRAKTSAAGPNERVGLGLRNGLGARLREAREARNMTLRELARRLGLSPSLISQVETGKSQPSISTLFAIVGELEIPVNEVVWEADPDGRDPGRRSRDADATRSHSPVQRAHERLSIHIDSGVSW